MTPKLSVLLVNWNGWRDLQRCIVSLGRGESPDFEIVVIDNGSTDESVENLRQEFPGVRLHANATNLGSAPALNLGFTLVQSQYILRLDPDTEMDRESIALLVRFLDEHPDVAMVAPRTYNTDGTVQESARNFPTVVNAIFGRQSLLSRVFPNNPFTWKYLARHHLTTTEPFEVEQVSGASMLFRRSLVEEVGPWDEGYPPAYWDDTDWCMQLRKHGKRIFCVPKASVIHHENNQANKKKSSRRIWMFHMGAYRLYRKHYTLGTFDPRALFALAGLSTRAGLLLVRNHFLPGQPVEAVPSQPLAESVREAR